MNKSIKHECPSCSDESICLCKICKNSTDLQLCFDCFKKRKIVTIATKVIYQLYENRTDYDEDYDRYLNI